MSNSNWAALVLASCLGACGDRPEGIKTFGDTCDIEVLSAGHPNLVGGWPVGTNDFVIIMSKDADWVNPDDGDTSYLELCKDKRHIVNVLANEEEVKVVDERGNSETVKVVRRTLNGDTYPRGMVVDIDSDRAGDGVILWLIKGKYAYEVKILNK